MDDKDIRFVNKKVDESWKDQAEKDKVLLDKSAPKPAASSAKSPEPNRSNKASKPFADMLHSLGYQALMHMGELPGQEAQEVNLEAAREIIDLLIALKNKTEGNLAPEELQLFESILPGLQMKFSEKV